MRVCVQLLVSADLQQGYVFSMEFSCMLANLVFLLIHFSLLFMSKQYTYARQN